MKRAVCIVLCAVFLLGAAAAVFVAAGCNLNNADTVVAQVGDKTIKLGEFESMFNMYLTTWQNYGYDMTSNEEDLIAFQDNGLALMVGELVVLYQGEKQGMLELNDEQKAELQEKIDYDLNELIEYYTELAQEEGAEDIDARVRELVEEEAEHYVGSMSYDEYIAYLKQTVEDNYLISVVESKALESVTASDEAIKTWYDTKLEEQKTKYDDDPSAYKDDMEYYNMYGGEPVLYTPKGYHRILQIYTTAKSSLGSEYTALKGEIAALLSEYGELAVADELSGEENNSERLKEIVKEYRDKKKEADDMFEEHYKDAREKIEEAYEKLEAGTPFSEVMMEYTEDVNIKNFEALQNKGMLISDGDEESYVDWSKEVKTAFAGLKKGEYSEMFMDEDGYHIIYYLDDETSGEAPLEEYREAIAELVATDAHTAEWQALIEEWMKDESVTIYTDRIRHVGRKAETTGSAD